MNRKDGTAPIVYHLTFIVALVNLMHALHHNETTQNR